MPRLPTSLILNAYQTSPLLIFLLRPCRDLQSARNELRWLREHAIALAQTKSSLNSIGWRTVLRRSCEERGRGKPLQYILGSQPFGDVDILCRPGVLIPRPETEAYTTHLANLILSRRRQYPQWPRDSNVRNAEAPLRILDLCSGTGCIPILLHSLLSTHIADLQILGVDISPKAIALAQKNLHRNTTAGNLSPAAHEQVRFLRADVLGQRRSSVGAGVRTLNDVSDRTGHGDWDIVISNPPYISPKSFNKDTARSVRTFEPKLALVPSRAASLTNPSSREFEVKCSEDPGDFFYPSLLATAERVNAKMLVMEVADMKQAERVVALMQHGYGWDGVEIWRDWLDERDQSSVEGEIQEVGGRDVRVCGEGNGRAVVCYRGCEWIEA